MSSNRYSWSATLFFLLILVFVANAANVTVDDDSSAWTYHSVGNGSQEWGEISPTHTCSFCLSRPDPAQAYNRTWHDTDINNSASLAFTGIALTVYIICPGPTSQGFIYATNYTFMLDGAGDGSFTGLGCAALTYNYTVYSKKGLAPTSHVFTITNAAPPPSISQPRSDLLLDYAVYDDGGIPSTTSSSTRGSTSSSGGTALPQSMSPTPSPTPTNSQPHGWGISTILGIIAASVFVVRVMA